MNVEHVRNILKLHWHFTITIIRLQIVTNRTEIYFRTLNIILNILRAFACFKLHLNFRLIRKKSSLNQI